MSFGVKPLERGGAAVILHRNGRVLLQKRTSDAPRWPSMWAVFGGNFYSDESPEDAAVREVEEELGISLCVDSIEFVCKIAVHVGDRTGYAHYFAAPLTVPLKEIRLQEGGGFALFESKELEGLSLIPHAREALEHFFKQLVP